MPLPSLPPRTHGPPPARAALALAADPKKFASAQAAVKSLETRFEAVKKRALKLDSLDCVGAYVVFQCEESVRRCLEDYAGSGSVTSLAGFWLQAPPLRFRGKHRLTVSRAPDPSQIVWQSLELTPCQRFLRQTAVNALLVALLVVSFLFVILAQAQQSEYRASIPNLQLCNTVLPAVAYGQPLTNAGSLAAGASLPSGLSLLHDAHDPICQPLGMPRLHWSSSSGNVAAKTSRGAANPCLNECVDTHARCTWPVTGSGAGNMTFPLTTTVACYCVRLIAEQIESKGIFTGAASVVSSESVLCGQVAVDYVVYQAFVVVGACVHHRPLAA